MKSPLHDALDRILTGSDLSVNETHAAISQIMSGQADESVIGAFLTALKIKGETSDEIAGAARAMRERATPITCRQSNLLDTCGTGGDELRTFNISTATALVAGAAGVTVAKHGNRSVSSSSGSAEVLEQLGVKIDLSADAVAECIDEIGIGFCFAPIYHQAMKHAAPVRRQLGFRTIFNLIGPLCNPANAEYQLLGASRTAIAEKLASALADQGRKHALVVCGADELDEVCLWGETSVFRVSGRELSRETWTPDSFGLAECRVADLQVDSPAESASMIGRILEGESGPPRDIVLANASAALTAAGHVSALKDGVARAAESIDSGAAKGLCQQLVERTNA